MASETGEVVVITGASAGVGRAVARLFGERKAKIGLLARGKEGLEGARREIEAAGGEALVLPTDVADPDRVEAAAEAVEARFGPIDIWVNNAMATVLSPFKEMTPEEFKRVTEVTYLGSVYGTMAALRRMLPRNRGDDHPGRLRTRLPIDPAAVGLLRGQTCGQRIYRLDPLGIDSRPKRRADYDGAAPGAEYASVRLGQDATAESSATGSADLSAGARGGGDRPGGAPSPPGMGRRLARRQSDPRK
ncbi:MAG: SDR family NAD(P)-dependent oxidoreductase [Candidatus Manganitrophus sp.]|nr:MAG: SDR family NAD(P)-dependent oxidoreductase [Candidatus Manganitrophus sp.]